MFFHINHFKAIFSLKSMKTKLLMLVLVTTLLMIGSVSGSIIFPAPNDDSKGKQSFQLGYDCYKQPGVYWTDCKQVEHKVSWFKKNGFYRRLGVCYPGDGGWWFCPHVWHRLPKA